jgi:hypothetical protein
MPSMFTARCIRLFSLVFSDLATVFVRMWNKIQKLLLIYKFSVNKFTYFIVMCISFMYKSGPGF